MLLLEFLFFNFQLSLDSYSFWGLCPEAMLISFILLLIMVAITTPKNQKVLLLDSFLNWSTLFFLVFIFYYIYLLSSNLFPEHLTVFFCYSTLKLNRMLIVVKMMLSFFAAGSLMAVKRYLKLYQLPGYEYPLLISLATLSMFFSVSANNWIILFLSLEFQALCFLVLFAWNRRSEKAINATLKFTVINFVASTLILLALIEIILFTQTFNMHLANPIFFIKSFLSHKYSDNSGVLNSTFMSWGAQHGISLFKYQYLTDVNLGLDSLDKFWYMVDNPAELLNKMGYSYQSLWQFTGFLIVVGFAMKLGLVPFGFWLQDLYGGVSLPVLTFFSTAPKLTYMVILLSLYMNLFSYVNPEAFLYPFLILGVVTVIVGNIVMFTVRNNLLTLLAWSSIANMGLLFFLFGKYPLNSYTLTFISYYTISTFLFFLLMQYFLIMDETGSVRHPIYFNDLSVVRNHPAARLIFMALILSFLNFFGIPPLLNFWMKFTVLQGLVINSLSASEWFLLVGLALTTIIGGFSYIRIIYTLLTENNHLGLHLLYYPNTKNDAINAAIGFGAFQWAAYSYYNVFLEQFSIFNFLSTNILLILPY